MPFSAVGISSRMQINLNIYLNTMIEWSYLYADAKLFFHFTLGGSFKSETYCYLLEHSVTIIVLQRLCLQTGEKKKWKCLTVLPSFCGAPRWCYKKKDGTITGPILTKAGWACTQKNKCWIYVYFTHRFNAQTSYLLHAMCKMPLVQLIQQLDIDISTWCNVTFFWVWHATTYKFKRPPLRRGLITHRKKELDGIYLLYCNIVLFTAWVHWADNDFNWKEHE